jgi:hypothetical protein
MFGCELNGARRSSTTPHSRISAFDQQKIAEQELRHTGHATAILARQEAGQACMDF